MDNVCMLYQGDQPHSAHRAFGDAIDSVYQHFESGQLLDANASVETGGVVARIRTAFRLSKDIDILIAEGSAPLQTALLYGLFRNHSAVVLYLAADETFYTLDQRISRYIWKATKPITSKIIGGCIAVSEQAAEWCEPYLGHQRIKIVHPPIAEENYKKLSEIEPHSPNDPFHILSVGERRDNKNHEELVEAVGRIASDYDRQVTLTLVGKGHENAAYADKDYVSAPGFVPVDEFIQMFSNASVYVQPSTADAYPVASLEAMLSATPTIVTENVGTAHRLPSEQVCKPSAEHIQSAISHLINLSPSERQLIGERHRESVKHITVVNQQGQFSTAVKGLLTKHTTTND